VFERPSELAGTSDQTRRALRSGHPSGASACKPMRCTASVRPAGHGDRAVVASRQSWAAEQCV